jgi:flagellar basal-body rod protein FlgG
MDNALWVAKTGLQAQDEEMSVTANNISNANTVGYKEERADFSDLMYQNLRQAGAQVDRNVQDPTGLQIGTGVRIDGTEKNFKQGNVQQTGRQLDLMVQGNGFLQVQKIDGTIAYTRNGALSEDEEGNLVTSAGYPIIPQITVPPAATSISIGTDGTVQATIPGQTQPQALGQITLATFSNPEGLENLGGSLYAATTASGVPIVGNPGQQGVGTILQGALESSNVSIVNELVKMIQIQRAYEMNSNAISIANKMSEYLNSHVD